MTKQSEFISKVKDGAISSYLEVGILPSVTIAQAILESGWGSSKLSTEANNLFGIKGDYNGSYYESPTKEYVNGKYIDTTAKFRKYPSFNESIEDHGDFLTADRYKGARWLTNYKEVTKALATAGYATDPNYASKLDELVSEYSLDSYDKVAISESSKNDTTGADSTAPASSAPVDSSTGSNDTSSTTSPSDTNKETLEDSYLLFSSVTLAYLDKDLTSDALIYDKDSYVKLNDSYTDPDIYLTSDNVYVKADPSIKLIKDKGVSLLDSYTS